MKTYVVEDIFTPSSPARINFIERETINTRIVRALKTKGKQVVIYGHSGSGKTTLLENKLLQVYEKHIKTNCMEGMTFEQVLLDGFDKLSSFYIDEKVVSGKISVDCGVKANFNLINANLSYKEEAGEQEKAKRVAPPQLTGPNLARLIGEAKYCWVLEDFHKIEEEDKKKLAQLMKVFMDLSDEYPELKIVAVGAVNTARQVVQFDKEMRRRVAEIHVPLMSDNEIEQIIINGFKYLNVGIDSALIKDICTHSNGVASICHQLCALMCEEVDVFETVSKGLSFNLDYSNLTYALSEYLELESDTMKTAFDNAFKLSGSENIIYALSKFDQEGAKIEDIKSKLKQFSINYNESKIMKILQKLITDEFGELLKYDDDSHRYSFSDPFYRISSLAILKAKDSEFNKKSLTSREMTDMLNLAFRMLKEDFSVSQSVTPV
ncbi:hypothetical protein LZS85_12610 [Aliivibrio fischeri]|uniref:hypothetical protein n=1 Tax=Aliivibrio fischeri TaxID=668 RepID=UPI001F3A8F39|nr:hypothetical protein [Aliivibrio fischeri]MCE7566959.1 hypothetical protein [Aliivibrio fischeri]